MPDPHESEAEYERYMQSEEECAALRDGSWADEDEDADDA